MWDCLECPNAQDLRQWINRSNITLVVAKAINGYIVVVSYKYMENFKDERKKCKNAYCNKSYFKMIAICGLNAGKQ